MTFHAELRRELIRWLGSQNITFYATWDDKTRGISWAGGEPVALLCHHTAGAATDKTDPKHPGNRREADQSQATFVQTHYKVPAANFTLGRSGHLWVHSLYPVWHAGEGSFTGVTPYNTLGIPDDKGNDYMLGVECVSKGLKKDFTAAEKLALGRLAQACKAATGWRGFTKRLPNHRTWAPTRKIDTRYELEALKNWALSASPYQPGK